MNVVMLQPPETRASLIRRLPNAADAEAWNEFVGIYEPLLFRLARGRGLQQADAEDFVQEVLATVAKSVERWVEDQNRGPFRAWLFRIASNLAVNFLSRPKHRRLGSGDSQIRRLLEEQAAPTEEATDLFALEYRRELFRWAAEQVREQVSERAWLAFWRTTVEEEPIPQAASQLGMSMGAVYIARSRITKRITDCIRRHEEQAR